MIYVNILWSFYDVQSVAYVSTKTTTGFYIKEERNIDVKRKLVTITQTQKLLRIIKRKRRTAKFNRAWICKIINQVSMNIFQLKFFFLNLEAFFEFSLLFPMHYTELRLFQIFIQ